MSHNVQQPLWKAPADVDRTLARLEIAGQIHQRGIAGLTLRHPWVWCIVSLGKRVENRRWKPALAVGTWYAIHGGKMPVGDELSDVADHARELALKFRHKLPSDANPKLQDAILTGIVALAKHGGCVKESADPWFDGAPYIGWKMDDLFVLEQPVPCRGAQGLWRVPDDIAEQLLRQLS